MFRKTLILIVLALLPTFEALAIGRVSGAKVQKIRVDLNGRAMIFFDKPIGGSPPACVHSAYKSAYGIDTRTDGGKAILSFALTAKATNSTVLVYGMGVCGIYGGSVIETWNHGFLL